MNYIYYYLLREGGEPNWAREIDLNNNINSSGHLLPKSKCNRISNFPHSLEDGFIAETSQLLERGVWSRRIFLKKLSRMILKGSEVIEKDSILWRASECPCECDSAVTSPIIPIEHKSIDPEEEFC